MPLTREQERLRQLFAGNPLANRPLPEFDDAPVEEAKPYTPHQTAQLEYTTNAQPQQTSQPYQDAVANRFAQITQQGANATGLAYQDAAARRAKTINLPAVNMPKSTGYKPTGGGTYTPPKGSLSGNAERDKIIRLVAAQKGMPYSWGGGNSKGPSYGLSGAGERHGSSRIYGFDCSGLVQYAYAQIGIQMPRLGNQQLARGTRIPMSQAKPGDLVGKPGHIAIYAGNGMMWEAPTFGKHVRYVPVRAGMFAVHVQGVG